MNFKTIAIGNRNLELDGRICGDLEVERELASGSDLERQEKLTSALWGFAYDLQHEEHNCKSGDGTTVNLQAVGRAQEIILGIFGQQRIEIQ